MYFLREGRLLLSVSKNSPDNFFPPNPRGKYADRSRIYGTRHYCLFCDSTSGKSLGIFIRSLLKMGSLLRYLGIASLALRSRRKSIGVAFAVAFVRSLARSRVRNHGRDTSKEMLPTHKVRRKCSPIHIVFINTRTVLILRDSSIFWLSQSFRCCRDKSVRPSDL